MPRCLLHILKRCLVTLLVGLYFLVALLNFTVVQSYLGAWAGSYFSKEWGGKVRIGALHISPLSHVLIDDLLLVSPTDDTIYDGERLSVRFNHFPVRGGGIDVDRVRLKNVRYHFESLRYPDGTAGINLDYIIKHYAVPSVPDTTPAAPFSVKVDLVVLDNVNYIQDLPEPKDYVKPDHGVSIPHMRYLDIHGRIKRVRVLNDSVTCRMVTFKTQEASGLQINDLSMDVVVSPHIISATNMELVTGDSRLLLDATLEYPGWEGMSDYLHRVRHNVVFREGTEVDVCEAAYWAPPLYGAQGKCKLQGHFYGTIADFHAEEFYVDFGTESYIYFDAALAGLPDIKTSTLNADIHRLHTTYADLAAVRHPAHIQMKFPELVRRLGVIDLEAVVRGGFSDQRVELSLNTKQGDLRCCLASEYDPAIGDFVYVGEVDSRQLALATLLHNAKMPNTGFHLAFQGSGISPQTMDAQVDGSLYNTNLMGHPFARTIIALGVSGQKAHIDVSLHDPLGRIDLLADADLNDSSCRLDLVVDSLRLSDLRLVGTDSNVVVSTHLRGRVAGTSLDRMAGQMTVSDISVDIGSRHIGMDSCSLSVAEEHARRRVALRTDWCRLILSGYFDYADLPQVGRTLLSTYTPAYFAPDFKLDKKDLTSAADFDLDFLWTAANDSVGGFLPGFALAKGTSLHATYNCGDGVRATFRSDRVTMNNLCLHDVGISARPMGETYRVSLKADNFAVGDVPAMTNVCVAIGAGRTISTLSLKWDDDPASTWDEGDLEIFVSSSADDNKILITKPDFYIGGMKWSVVCPDGIYLNRDRIEVERLKVYGLDQSVTLKMRKAKGDDDFVRAAFDDFSLGHVCGLILADKRLKINGILDGNILVRNLSSGNPNFDADLRVDDFVLNEQHAGRVNIRSNYVPEEARLNLDVSTDHLVGSESRRPIELHGNVRDVNGVSQMDFVLNMRRVALQTVGPIVADITSNVDGILDGDLHVHGSSKSPKIDGTLKISNGQMKINATGVDYFFDDEFRIANGSLSLKDFVISDKASNSACVNGAIALDEGRLNMNLALRTDGITAFDKKPDGDNFYGRVLVSADGTVKGYVDDLAIEASATALGGSEVYVPVTDRKQAADDDFVTFVSTDKRDTVPAEASAKNGLRLLQVNFAVSQGVKVHLPMNFTGLSTNVTAMGNGDVQVSMGRGRQLSLLGDYVFTSGNVSLEIGSLLTRNFAIEAGSTINFPGDLQEARFDLNAVYNQRVNLATLTSQNSSGSSNDSYVRVQSVINLSGTLGNPAVKFDLRLPDADQTVSDQVFALIDRTNERDMMLQTVSILSLGRFQSAEASANSDLGANILASSASTLLSNMVKVVDVKFKYQSATAKSSGKFDVGISRQWDKFYFESSFGYGVGNTTADVQNNAVLGDFEVGYKFNPYVQGLVFDRTNTSFYTHTEIPRKQGVGIKLSKDFNTLSDIFPWLRKKEKEPHSQTHRP